MAQVGPYRAEQSAWNTTGTSTALTAGNAHSHYVFGMWVAPSAGLGVTDARVSAANTTSAAVALIAGSTASTDTILVRSIYWAKPAVGLAVADAGMSAANSTSAAVALIAGTTVSTDSILVRGVFIAQSTLAGAANLINGSSTGSTLITLNFVTGTSPFNGYMEFPGGGVSFDSSAGVFYQSTALTGITAFYSTGANAQSTIAGTAVLVNGSSTGSTLLTLNFPADNNPGSGHIELPGAGISFDSSAGVFYQSTSLSGITAFYSTGVLDTTVALVNGSSTGSTLAKFVLPPGTPPQYIPFPLGAMKFSSTSGVYLEAANTQAVSVFYSTQ